MGNDLHMLQLLRSIFSKSCLIDAMVNWRLKVQGSNWINVAVLLSMARVLHGMYPLRALQKKLQKKNAKFNIVKKKKRS